MRKMRFYYPDILTPSQLVTLDSATSHQIAQVLRLKVGQQLYLFNNAPYDFSGLVKSITKNAVQVQITAQTPNATESPLKIHLVQAIAKGQKMDFIIQKAVELGVAQITPIISEYTIVKLASTKIADRIEHWQNIIKHACSQSWRSILPIINPPLHFAQYLKTNQDQLKIMLDPYNGSPLKQTKIMENIAILIGPEGGFSEVELALARSTHCLPITMGPRILRTETAALAAITSLQLLYGDL